MDSCNEAVLAVRNGSWLINASPEDVPGSVFEVAADGATAIDLPSGEIIVL